MYEFRKFIGWITRKLFPTYSYCKRCGMSWGLSWVKPHSTDYRKGYGCFPLCEWCWERLTPGQRLPYYNMLIDIWYPNPDTEEEKAAKEEITELIRAAVIAGK
jgi:hypothetical protein